MSKIYFATNRNQTRSGTGFGSKFNPDGLACLRFGSAVQGRSGVNITVAKEMLVANEHGTAEDTTRCRYGSLEVFSEMREAMLKDGQDALVFVHGYNNSFRDSLRTGFKLAKQFPDLKILVFSWPSDGSMAPWLAYASDRHDAVASGPALARGLLKFTDFLHQGDAVECKQQVHLMAHSMGAYVVRHALQYYRQNSHQLRQILTEITLLAADEDSNAFEKKHKLKALPNIASRVSVYFNRRDQAMAISDLSKGNPERLGQEGLRQALIAPAKVCQVDCTAVVNNFPGHNYYLKNTKVIADLSAVFAGEESEQIRDRRYQIDQHRFVIEP